MLSVWKNLKCCHLVEGESLIADDYNILILDNIPVIPNNTILGLPQLRVFADYRLTLSQITNFRLFQTERVCRQQF